MKAATLILMLCLILLTACGQNDKPRFSASEPTAADLSTARQTADALALHAELLLVTPNPFMAMGELGTAIALDPTVARYHLDLGMAHFYAAGYEQAIVSFNTAMELDPTMSAAYYYRGQSAYILQDYDLALESYEASWDLDYCDAMMVDHMVDMYEQRGDQDAVQAVQNRTC